MNRALMLPLPIIGKGFYATLALLFIRSNDPFSDGMRKCLVVRHWCAVCSAFSLWIKHFYFVADNWHLEALSFRARSVSSPHMRKSEKTAKFSFVFLRDTGCLMPNDHNENFSGGDKNRGRMIEQCIFLHQILVSHQRIAIKDIVSALRVSRRTVDRWLDSFSLVLPIRIERGIVIVERDQI